MSELVSHPDTVPPVVTDAMVDAAFTEARQFCGFNPWPDDDLRETMRDVLTAAMAVMTEADV